MRNLKGLAANSIRAKLSLLVVMTGGIALLLTGIFLFGYEKFNIRRNATRELSTQAAILSASSVPDLIFEDERGATKTLSSLSADPNMIEAVLYDGDKLRFAWYQRAGSKSGLPSATPIPEGVHFDNDKLVISRPILAGNVPIGFLTMKTSMAERYSRSHRYIAVVCLVLTASLTLALLFGGRMQRTITEPIAELSRVAKIVSSEKDYTARAIRRTNDEIGLLVDSFNEMLRQIEIREDARRGAEESLRESEQRYALAARGANDGLWDWKLATNEIYFSQRWNEMLGYPESENWTSPEDWFARIHLSDRARVMAELAAHRAGITKEFVSEYRMRKKNGAFVWMLSRGIAFRDKDGTAVRMAGSQTDITEGKIGDPLTGLPNRLYFLEKLDSSIEALHLGGNGFAVLFLDLDRFKQVNDSLGHAVGDELLIGIAARIRSSVLSINYSEGNGPPAIARLGGDEFGVLLNDIREESDARAAATEILRNIELPFHFQGHEFFVGASIGISLGSSAKTPEDLLRNADTAMYHAKGKGRARYAVFHDSMRERALVRLEVETDLRRAIELSQLILHFQPEISLSSQNVIGYEALVRWNHPQRGLLRPDEFIPVAEESDLIIRLGRWVLREACRQMAEWHHRFQFEPPLSISVNVSARQLSDTSFVSDVQQSLAETALDPRCLKLELTESSIMGDPETTLNTLMQLKFLNVGLEMDDFGTGYSSLSYLQRFPFDTVKIDRSFIRQLETGAESSEIVKTIIELARSLKMNVIAEGVETESQLRRLSALGCDVVQGYYFSEPLSAEQTQIRMQLMACMKPSLSVLENALAPAARVATPSLTY